MNDFVAFILKSGKDMNEKNVEILQSMLGEKYRVELEEQDEFHLLTIKKLINERN